MNKKFLSPGQPGPVDQDYRAFYNNYIKISDNVFLTKMPCFLIFFEEDSEITSEAKLVQTYIEPMSIDDAVKDKQNIYFFLINEEGIQNKRYYKLALSD